MAVGKERCKQFFERYPILLLGLVWLLTFILMFAIGRGVIISTRDDFSCILNEPYVGSESESSWKR